MSYILNVSFFLAICAVFYRLLLIKETFFRLNRYVLLSCLVLSFLLPLVPIPQKFSLRKVKNTGIISQVASLAGQDAEEKLHQSTGVNEGGSASGLTTEQLFRGVIWLYWAGVIIFGITFLVQLVTLLYRAASLPFIQDGRFRIVEMSGDTSPCSFGNSIFINPEKYDWETYNQIILHEKVHIREGHSLDLILSEIVLVFHWFNPFAWLYRKELENNLEFLTDQQVLSENEVEQESYQLSLLKVSAPHFPLNLTTNYNQSLLKKRFAMMNSKRSSMSTAWKYFFLLPLFLGSVSLINEPMAYGATKPAHLNSLLTEMMSTEGNWYASSNGIELAVIFRDAKGEGQNNSVFPLHKLRDFANNNGSFSLKRDAGTMHFTGRFSEGKGSGSYAFTSDKNFATYLRKEGVQQVNETDMLSYFLVNVTSETINTLKKHGYKERGKEDLLVFSALGVSSEFINMLKDNGFTELPFQDVTFAKSLNVDEKYIQSMQQAGFKNMSLQQLIASKSQGIEAGQFPLIPEKANNAAFVREQGSQEPVVHTAKSDTGKIVNRYEESVKEINKNVEKLLARVQGDLTTINQKNSTVVTKDDYLATFKELGYLSPDDETITSLMVSGVSISFIRSFHNIGIKNQDPRIFLALKNLRITAANVQEYRALGLSDVTLSEVVDARSKEVSPEFIKKLKDQGHHLPDLKSYITLKAKQF